MNEEVWENVSGMLCHVTRVNWATRTTLSMLILPGLTATLTDVDREKYNQYPGNPFDNGTLIEIVDPDDGRDMKWDLYEHETKRWPNGTSTKCLSCGKAIRVSEPAVATRSTHVGTLAFHYECLQELAKLTPSGITHDRIAEQIAITDGDPFGFKKRNGYA